jgi:aerobic carbon-monoxide dehydrogenase medium subunit
VKTFEYHAPRELGEVFELLDKHGEDAHLLAGGTSTMLLMRQGLVQPDHVVALGGVPGLNAVARTPDGGLSIGAMATHRAAEVSPAVSDYCPALAETFSRVATIRIRNQGTVGGNLVHADPAQDPPPMLMVLGAEALVSSAAGDRVVPLNDGFFVDYFETALRHGDVLTEIRMPALAPGTRAAYTKFLPRTKDDYATVAVAAALRLADDGTMADVRVALGAAAVTPLRATPVEDALRGQHPTPSLIKEAAALTREVVDPLDDVRGSANYKREMARVWVERMLLKLLS